MISAITSYRLGGYISDAGRVHLPRAEILLRAVAAHEEEIFTRRRKREEGRERNEVRHTRKHHALHVDARAIIIHARVDGYARVSSHDVVRCVWQAARRAAAGEAVDPSSFGGLYPPRDETQQWLHKAISDFAAADAADAPPTLALPPSLSGFHKASAHLYATLLGCSETSGEQGGITLKRKRQSASGGGGGGGSEARRDFGADEDLDFETRLTLRLQKKESELQQQARIEPPRLNAPPSSYIRLYPPSSSPAIS